MRLRRLVSIHDVLPKTLHQVDDILNRLSRIGVESVTLLIIPGVDWKKEDLSYLARRQKAGIELAGHGWFHRSTPRTPYHRLHSRCFSRKVAEHLALDEPGILDLMDRCHRWFPDHGLSPPTLYVPPAWALGVPGRRLHRRIPFPYVETLAGIQDTVRNRFHPLPLAGFEADTALRKHLLRVINRIQIRAARALNRPIRIAIHPDDFKLKLARDLDRLLDPSPACVYSSLAFSSVCSYCSNSSDSS
ncbi:MAG: polysaccharide deacetylase family protein [Desulfococcaceae bacterium]